MWETSFQHFVPKFNPEYGIEGIQVKFRAQALASAYGLLMQENKECPETASTRLPYPEFQGVKEVTDDSRLCYVCSTEQNFTLCGFSQIQHA